MDQMSPGGIALIRYALKKAGAKPGMDLLDAGCGDGKIAGILQNEDGYKVTAIDSDESMVKLSRKKKLDSLAMDASDLLFEPNSFDVVITHCVLSVSGNEKDVTKEAFRVLKNGGYLIITDVSSRDKSVSNASEGFVENSAVNVCKLKSVLQNQGFKIVCYEDKTEDLKAFLGQAIFEYGSLDSWKKSNNVTIDYPKKAGYFLLIAGK